MGDAVFAEIVVNDRQIQPDLFRKDVELCAAQEGGPGVHHVGVKAKAGVGRRPAGLIHFHGSDIPLAEIHQIAVSELCALGCSGGTGGVQQDKGVFRCGIRRTAPPGQSIEFIGAECFSRIFRQKPEQAAVSNQQLCRAVLHHKGKTFGWIGWVQGLIGSAALQDAQRCHRHPLAARQQHRHKVAFLHAAGM